MDGPLETPVRPPRAQQASVALDPEGESAVASIEAGGEAPPVTTPLRSAEAFTEPPEPPSRLGVLRHTHFRNFYIAAFGSFLGNWFEFVGTQWIVAEKTKSMAWASYLATAQLAPTFILGLLGGIVADRVNRKKLLIVTQVFMMLIAIGFATVVGLNLSDKATLYCFLGLSMAQGIAIAFNNPAWQVLVPRLVPRDELVRAITLQGISFNAARAIGPALGGLIMGWWSPMILFAVNATSYIGVMIAVLSTPDTPSPANEAQWWRKVWSDTKGAAAFVWRQPGPRAALLACVMFGVFATPILRFLSLFVTNVYELQEKTFGVLTGVMGAGAVVGGLCMRLVPKWYPRHHFIPLSVLLGGVWILLFSIATNVWVAGTIMFFVGWFWMWAFNSSMSSLQMLVDDSMRGRAMAVCNTVSLGLMPVGNFFAAGAGHLAAVGLNRAWPQTFIDIKALETQIGVGLCALVLIGAGVIMITYRTPEVDGLKPGDPGYDRVPGFWRGLTAASHRPA